MKPFRILTLILLALIAVEACAFVLTPTYERELEEAEQAYSEAAREHSELVSRVQESGGWIPDEGTGIGGADAAIRE